MPVLDNTQHELFAHEIVKGASQRDAYRTAGYKVKSDAAADACASRLLSNARIKGRIEELKTQVETRTVEKLAVTRAWVIAKLVENVERAMTNEPVKDAQGTPTGEYKYNGNVANRALELLGKEQGMFVDRKEVGKPGDFADLTPEQLDEFIISEAQDLLEAPKRPRATKH